MSKPNESKNVAVTLSILLVVLVWGVFGQTLRYPFINYDDNHYVYENAQVSRGLSLTNAVWAFTHVHSENWHPLTTITHMLDCSMFELNAGGHHAVNVLLHSMAAVLLFAFLRTATGKLWPGFFVAALFAVHPLRAESVAWVAERKDVLSGLFFMLTLIAYVGYARMNSLGHYVTMSILYACGLMSKPMLVTLPFLLLLLDYWPLGRSTSWRLVVEKIPLFAMAISSSVATVIAQRPTISSLANLPMTWRIENAIVAIGIYLRQFFWPNDLGVVYPHPYGSISLTNVGLCAALIVATSIVAFFMRKSRPYLIVGWLWFLGLLVPVLGIAQVGQQAHADRYTYLPEIGLAIMVTWLLADLSREWPRRLFILRVAGVGVLICLTTLAFHQTRFWRDSFALWSHTLDVTKNNDTAELCLAALLLERGQLEEAIKHSRAAVNIRPENAGVYGRVPVVLTDEQTRQAIAHWQQVIAADPRDVSAHNDLGVILFQGGDARAAVTEWETSLAISPNDGNAQNNLAWALATYPDEKIHNPARAVQLAEGATQLPHGDEPLVQRTLAAACAANGDFARAIDVAEQARATALRRGNDSLVQTLQHEIDLYRRREVYHEIPRRN